MELVNAVGGGELHTNIDRDLLINLQELYSEITEAETKYDPESYPGLVLNFTDHDATVMLFGSGKFNIAGAKSIDDLLETRDRFIEVASGHINLQAEGYLDFEIRNLVYKHQMSKELDLDAVSVALGLASVEYNPEQHPAIQYRVPDSAGVIFIYSSGYLIETGIASPDEAERNILLVEEKINELFKETTG